MIVRRRVFFADGTPVALTDSYYPADMAGDTAIERPERMKGAVHALIEEENGPIRRKTVPCERQSSGRVPASGQLPTHPQASGPRPMRIGDDRTCKT